MKFAFVLFITLLLPYHVIAQEKIIHIYQDADLSSHKESSEAIQKGIEVAFAEIDNEIAGYKVIFKYLDHRGNVLRSKRNYQIFIDDPKALAIYSGIHSPPLIKNRTFINENDALTLVPWAAGGPITRYPSSENWIFRLSIDDTKAGMVIVDYTMKNKECKQPHLFLEDTPWGDSNLKNMSQALHKYGIYSPSVTRFGWNLTTDGARILLRKVFEAEHDCLIFVGNAIEGSVIAQTMLNFSKEERLPIISHWGITGGDFHKKITVGKRKNLDLYFIQSCFAFTNPEQHALANAVFKKLVTHSNQTIKEPEDLKSAVGFIHAYDLTKLLIQAINKAGLTGDITKDRNAIRLALENLDTPVQGLVKNYTKPFSVFNHETNPDAHEALDYNHYCMGQYGEKDEVLILQ